MQLHWKHNVKGIHYTKMSLQQLLKTILNFYMILKGTPFWQHCTIHEEGNKAFVYNSNCLN